MRYLDSFDGGTCAQKSVKWLLHIEHTWDRPWSLFTKLPVSWHVIEPKLPRDFLAAIDALQKTQGVPQLSAACMWIRFSCLCIISEDLHGGKRHRRANSARMISQLLLRRKSTMTFLSLQQWQVEMRLPGFLSFSLCAWSMIGLHVGLASFPPP